uniref:Ycf80 n=1 Tax=Thaumatella adunca TaxID=2006976 RepID=A0A1Z1MNA6_9FLOR|nr:hypothetical protein [Thaumatella adunca]ARW67406.1 hypothetical protein [Thaumatella adunca]
MIESNFTLFYTILQKYCKNEQPLTLQINQEQKNYKNISNLMNFKFNRSSCIFISNSKVFTAKVPSKLLENKMNNKLVIRNLWQKMINRYLQETIFLSKSNSLSNNYISKLKTLGLSVYEGNEYKNFLYKFSKDLLNGKIQLYMNKTDNLYTSLLVNKNNIYLRYKWFKFPNFSIFNFNNHRHKISDVFKLNQKHLNSTSLPLFMLVNNNHEIILSESYDQLFKSRKLFNLYARFTNKDINAKKSYIGLVFVNPQDALEYKEYIKNKYINSTRLNKVSYVITNMNLYYKLIKSVNNCVEFRLVPDLKEVGDLTYAYKYYKNLSFDNNQNYGNTYFQGQPIYLIQSTYARNKNKKYIKKIDYFYSFKQKKSSFKYKAVFLNYETAISAWQKFVEKNIDYNLPVKPNLSVSNLETFIQEPYYKKNHSKIIFLPSLRTYDIIKNYLQSNLQNKSNLKYWIVNKSVYFQTLCYRIIWSLTSRQPLNW